MVSHGRLCWKWQSARKPKSKGYQFVLILDYKLRVNRAQETAIDEAIRTVQFIRNKCLRKWMDGRGIGDNALQVYCPRLAREFPFAACLNSQARQASADRAWLSIARFYKNSKEKKPGKKGYPQFQHDNRSVEYKATGWRLEPDGKHLTFTDGMGIGTVSLIGANEDAQESAPSGYLPSEPDQAGSFGQTRRWLLRAGCRKSGADLAP
jgi:putative transposase